MEIMGLWDYGVSAVSAVSAVGASGVVVAGSVASVPYDMYYVLCTMYFHMYYAASAA